MADIKHVGRLTTNKRKCIVAYRVIPGDPDNCLVVHTENLDASEHDALIQLVESNAGQTSEELALAMARTQLPDGRNMLAGFHTTGKLVNVPQTIVEMTPNYTTSVNLAELNKIIAEQRGVTVADLAIKDPSVKATTAGTVNNVPTGEVVEDVTTVAGQEALSDEALAAQYRSQADAMFKEAKRLREQAEELVPTKRKNKVEEGA